ncbi:MAG TPA: hypothetical protein VM925_27270 [Labilithrix sp.]|nr:hypothetical protein [Labilithrix sp.]
MSDSRVPPGSIFPPRSPFSGTGRPPANSSLGGVPGTRGTTSSRSLAPIAPPGGDAYADLLRDTRGLRREQSIAREQWLARVESSRREEMLFELEVLLKGLACFANPRNHAGPPRRTAIVAQDYREALVLARDAMHRVVYLCRQLLGEQERAFVFQRYLEMLLPDDTARTRLVRGASSQDTPEESLFLLRHALTNILEVSGGVTRLPRVPFRLFYAAMAVVHREVSQSAFFNPLVALEFRPEFDRITNPRVLELMRQVPGEQARRLVALTFLALFRMLRYVTLLEQVVRESRSAGLVHLVLSVLRSDARALTDYLRKQTGRQLADSFERELFKVPAPQIRARYDELHAEAHRLVSIKATLEGIAANVRLELRRAFEHDFAAPDGGATSEQLRASVATVAGNLRPALQNAVLVLGKALGARLDEHGVFDDLAAKRSLSIRLRRDVWMFGQIVRAFAAKARATPSREDRWSGPSSLQFVREFLSYFDAMGYPLLRAADYPRFDAFISALSALEETDLLDPARLDRAVREAERFYLFLSELFEQIGLRDELKGVPFDRRQAAEALKLYLGD